MYFAKDNCYKPQNNIVFNAGIYLRLSREDDDKGTNQSESIINQREFLTRIVLDNGWNLTEEYIDDGYSGTNFERPGFMKMLQDIECKRINMVLTKDLSRLGRDYIQTGHYLERYFPQHNIRYIAVNDGIDTFGNSNSNAISPFMSVINDMYARDISNKVRSTMDGKRQNGQFIGSFAPYGYHKNKCDKSKLVIDPETAPIVREIFNLYMKGHGYAYIANLLNAQGIISPVVYKAKTTTYKNPKNKLGLWTHESIKRILTNPTYAGNITQNRCKKVNYKLKKLINVPRSAWITIENTHEPIVDKAVFGIVQTMMQKNASEEYTAKKYPHLLSGLVYCGDCGEKMTYTKTQKGTIYLICSKYKRFRKLNLCTRHSFAEEELISIVKQELRKISEIALDKDKLIKLAKSSGNKPKSADAKSIAKIQSRFDEIKRIIKNLYEDKLKGIISEEDFINLSQDYNKEREGLNSKLTKLNQNLLDLHSASSEDNAIIFIVNEFSSFSNPDKLILIKLIDKIEIFENNKVMIHYKFKTPF